MTEREIIIGLVFFVIGVIITAAAMWLTAAAIYKHDNDSSKHPPYDFSDWKRLNQKEP